MYTKKIAFTVTTVPSLIFMHSLAEYHKRKRDDKDHEAARRRKNLA